MTNILDVIADDRSMITYRPNLRKITGSVTATILLQQILFRWKWNDKKPFYKFKEPCDHEKYKEGDSWAEELGFSRKEFDAALKKIGHKMGKTKTFKEKEKEEAFVWFRIDSERITWYEINETALLTAINRLYRVTTERGVSVYSTKGALGDKAPKGRYINTENTAENTSENTFVKAKRKKEIYESKNQDQEKPNPKPLPLGKEVCPQEFRRRFRSGTSFTPKQYSMAMAAYEKLKGPEKDVVDEYVAHEVMLSKPSDDTGGLRKYFICEYMNNTEVPGYWKSLTPEQRIAELENSPQYKKKKNGEFLDSLDFNDPNINPIDYMHLCT